MDGKAIAGKAIILQYVDEEPFSLKRSLVIYAIAPESVDYREFFVSEEIYVGDIFGAQHLDFTPLKRLPTEGRSHRAKDIEYMLKQECSRKGKNIIRIEDMGEELVTDEMVASHMSEYMKKQLEAIGLKLEE